MINTNRNSLFLIVVFTTLFSFTLVFPPIAAHSQTGFSVRSDVDDQLYSINLQSGVAIQIGATGFDNIRCLAFDASGTLYGVDPTTSELVTCSTDTGACSAVGALGVEIQDCGLTFDCNGELFMAEESEPPIFYSIDPNTGQATAIGDQGHPVTGLASRLGTPSCASGVFALGGNNTDVLGCMDVITGAFQEIGPLNNVADVDEGGIDFDSLGRLWGIEDDGSLIFTIDPNTGNATIMTSTISGFEGLAIDAPTCEPPAIPTMSEWGLIFMAGILGIVGFIVYRRKMATA